MTIIQCPHCVGDVELPDGAVGLFGRSLRFGLEAILVGIYGQKALDMLNTFLDNEILIAVGMIAIGLVVYFAWSWWSKLGESSNQVAE